MNLKTYQSLLIAASLTLGFSFSAYAQTSFESWSGQVFDVSQSPVIHTPRSLEQIVAIVKKASVDKKKIRISGARHSWNSIIISDTSTYVSTKNLNKIGPIQNRNGKAVITVQPGVMLGDLTDYLFDKGYSLGFAMPEFRGLTIGGLIATGSHGSSRKHPGVSTQIVNRIQLVKANGEVQELTAKNGDVFKAATLNLGVLGIVTQLELILTRRFNLKVTSSVMDLNQSSLIDFLNAKPQEDFLFVMWFPRLKKAILESGVISHEAAEKGAENILFGPHMGTLESDYGIANILAKGRADASGAVDIAIEAKRYEGLAQKPRFVVDVNGFDVSQDVVVGQSNKMLLARGNEITWPYKLSDYSFAFPISKLREVMETIEKFSLEKNYSFPNAGISMRFILSDGGKSSLLTQFQSQENRQELFVSAEFLEFRDFRAKGSTNGPRDPLRVELLNLLISKHSVKFHMGKNDDVTLKAEPRYSHSDVRYQKFLNIAQQLDPDGIFMSDFVSQILTTRALP